MKRAAERIVKVPWVRRLVIDAGRASRRRHSIHGLFEVDVTAARKALRTQLRDTGEQMSFTAFVVSCVARAVAAEPAVQAYRNLRGREVIFSQVDVGLPVEVELDGVPFAFTHVLRDAGRRSVRELHDEIRAVHADPNRSPSVRKSNWARAYLLLPAFVRTGLLGALHRFPHRQRAIAGTVGVSAVGMFAGGGGWGIGFQLHTLAVVVGGITVRPVLAGGRLVDREWLQLTVSVDHDVVDGAPAARFVNRLRALLSAADALEPAAGRPDRSGLSPLQQGSAMADGGADPEEDATMTEDSTRRGPANENVPVSRSSRTYDGLLKYLGARLYEEREHARHEDEEHEVKDSGNKDSGNRPKKR
ncbi:hypothetical protein GCM10009554_08860 [Kribbella koreensis]|uniref:2-oxoacid dehydrogenase acyltransferase catalytic domain-containing protein n=1 Tax=Kribbella koreensis TaxID=57909 RepID=A0ABN1PH94_9ACTN